MRTLVATLLAIAIIAGGFSSSNGVASSSDGFRVLTRLEAPAGPLAFEGNRFVMETGDGFDEVGTGVALYRMSRERPYVRFEGTSSCPSGGRTISLWRGFVIQSVPGEDPFPGMNDTPLDAGCENESGSAAKRGIRILDAREGRGFQEVAFLETPCGSIGHALVPKGDNVYILDAYDLPACRSNPGAAEALSMRVFKLDPSRPRQVRQVSGPGSGEVEACDRMTVHVKRALLACTVVDRLAIWDVSDPPNPIPLGLLLLPSNSLWETSFSWDGRYLLAGHWSSEEQCELFVIDVRDPDAPAHVGSFPAPVGPSPDCEPPISVSVIPTKDRSRRVALVGWRGAGLLVIDFSDPSRPRQIARYDKESIDLATWYNGRIYAVSRWGPLDAPGVFPAAKAEPSITVLKLPGLDRDRVQLFERHNPHTQAELFR